MNHGVPELNATSIGMAKVILFFAFDASKVTFVLCGGIGIAFEDLR